MFQQQGQRVRVRVPPAPVALPPLEELLRHLLVEFFGGEMAGDHPPTQPGYGSQLLLSGVFRIPEVRQLVRKSIEILAQRADTMPPPHGVVTEVLVHSVFLLLPLGLKENTPHYAERYTVKNG